MIQVENLCKSFTLHNQGGTVIPVMEDARFDVAPGECVGLVGASGAGKSTLLHIAGLLDTPDTGTVEIGGTDMTGQSDRKRTGVRRRDVGFIYQFPHLLPEFSAVANTALPQLAKWFSQSAAKDRARCLLYADGLVNRPAHGAAPPGG